MAMNARELSRVLDTLLDPECESERYATNGLQVEAHKKQIKKVGLCVDAALDTFQALRGCDLIICHHGLFWPTIDRVEGLLAEQIGFLFEHEMSLYASHLPLDKHVELGNNAQLIKHLEGNIIGSFPPVGYLAEIPTTTPQKFAQSCLNWSDDQSCRLLHFGGDTVKRIAVSSGGLDLGMLYQAHELEVDLVLSGEASHPAYHCAKQLGLNLMLAGHYQTETWGVRAVGSLLEEDYGLDTVFYDFPTGF